MASSPLLCALTAGLVEAPIPRSKDRFSWRRHPLSRCRLSPVIPRRGAARGGAGRGRVGWGGAGRGGAARGGAGWEE